MSLTSSPPDVRPRWPWLSWLACALLLAQLATVQLSSRRSVRQSRPASSLSSLELALKDWVLAADDEIPDDALRVLRPTDYVQRRYRSTAGQPDVDILVAYFLNYSSGAGPHSPAVCLPGAGWKPIERKTISIPVGEVTQPIQANRFLLNKEGENLLVLYWFQNRYRTVADENLSRLYLIGDSLRLRSRDSTLVRVAIRFDRSATEVDQLAADFARALSSGLVSYLNASQP